MQESKCNKKFNISILFFPFLFLFNSCELKKVTEIEGLWLGDQNTLIELNNDTLITYPNGQKYLFKVQDDSIVLLKPHRLKEFEQDTLLYPYNLGKLIILSDNNINIIISTYNKKNEKFKKMKKGRINIEKLQFTFGYDRNGYSFEVDSIGNSSITEESAYGIHNSYSFILSKKEIANIQLLLSNIDFNKLKEYYVTNDYFNYSFVFYSENKKHTTCILDHREHISLSPLLCYLETKIYKEYSLDTLKYTKIKKKPYESRVVICNNDTIQEISYLSLFDSVNYQMPVYDKAKLEMICNKYYEFSDYNSCYYISLNSLGSITNIDFEDSQISASKKLLEELEEIHPIKPAIYDGVRIAVIFFDCFDIKN